MNIIMVTNTYIPHVGGVAQSVKRFTRNYRQLGHPVMVIAPAYGDATNSSDGVMRVPSIRDFNKSGFSVGLPVPLYLTQTVRKFNPEIIHAHHPFLLGNTALRIAAARNLPVIFTHHTMYEKYLHYLPGDSVTLRRFVIELAIRYANLCDHVIAPSASVAEILNKRGIKTAISIIPTGVDTAYFASGNGKAFREETGIPPDAFVIGYVGRLEPEKNLDFLSQAVIRSLQDMETAHFLVVGTGSLGEAIAQKFAGEGFSSRLHTPGNLTGEKLVNAYHAMDIFAFASKTETQGMVLVEAMAAGIPVVGVDAPGVREVVNDGKNGRLITGENIGAFAEVLQGMHALSEHQYKALRQAARKTAESFSEKICARKSLNLYEQVCRAKAHAKPARESVLTPLLRRLEREWELFLKKLGAVTETIL
jgi:glycosyltransferase involved in cell wall biosynthesis